MGLIENLERMLEAGQDGPLLRFSLGGAYLRAGDYAQAALHLERALIQEPQFSAAWKLYGRALTDLGRREDAIHVYEKGVRVAEERGDKQAAREMVVFLKRLRRESGD